MEKEILDRRQLDVHKRVAYDCSMENMPSEGERPQGTGPVSTPGAPAAYGPRPINPYVLPASIVFAALIVSGSIIYLVAGGGGGEPKTPVNPLTLPYKGPDTAFSECVDDRRYAEAVQGDYAAATPANVNSTPTTFVNGVMVTALDPDGVPHSVGANGQLILQAIDSALADGTRPPTDGPLALNPRDVILGDPDAPVTIIEYGDYQCSFCTRFYTDVQPVIEQEYVATGKANFVFRDFPFLGQESYAAGEAVECAKELGKFWEYHNALYAANYEHGTVYADSAPGPFLSRDVFLNLAEKLGV
jgi:protein-disulfide isomerase